MRALTLLAVLALAGCGSDEPAASTTDASTDSNETPKVPASSCVRPGDKGNDKGVGEACTPLGKECAKFPGAPVCLADVGQDQWMCTKINCANDTECGIGATCYKDAKGSGCVPNRCLDAPVDAGGDAPMDAGGETSSDATAD